MEPTQDKEENVFDSINNWIRGTESSIVNFLSAIAPWGAPLPAAYMSYQHMMGILHFENWVAFPAAAVIEILGFSTVSTAMSFWVHNQRNKDGKDKAPIWVVLVAFAFYLGIVITMNVAIDANTGTENEKLAIIIVRALLTLMSIPAALVMAVRTQHNELVKLISIEAQREQEQLERERAEAQRQLEAQLEQERIIREEERLEREQIRAERREARQLKAGYFGNFGKTSVAEANRTPGKKQAVMSYISQYVTETGRLPKLNEIIQATGVVLSTASQFRQEWQRVNQVAPAEEEVE